VSSLNQNVIRHKIGLLNLATELGNVSKACKVMGLSRDTFYRYQNAVAEGGVEARFVKCSRNAAPSDWLVHDLARVQIYVMHLENSLCNIDSNWCQIHR